MPSEFMSLPVVTENPPTQDTQAREFCFVQAVSCRSFQKPCQPSQTWVNEMDVRERIRNKVKAKGNLRTNSDNSSVMHRTDAAHRQQPRHDVGNVRKIFRRSWESRLREASGYPKETLPHRNASQLKATCIRSQAVMPKCCLPHTTHGGF